MNLMIFNRILVRLEIFHIAIAALFVIQAMGMTVNRTRSWYGHRRHPHHQRPAPESEDQNQFHNYDTEDSDYLPHYRYPYKYEDNLQMNYELQVVNGDMGGVKVEAGPVEPIDCYMCHYQLELAYSQGSASCRDPFSTFNIPTIKCAGPCGKIYRKLEGKDEYSITRVCMPDCKDVRTIKSFTECCTTSLCNSALPSYTILSKTIHNIILSISVIFLYHFVN